LATEDALLFLWVPEPLLLSAAPRIFEAWGFVHRSGPIWDKLTVGMGFYVRQEHEHLLIGTRGRMPTPLPQNRPPSIIRAPRREHSRKPEEAYALIERMYPTLPRIELFARGPARPGWHAWGNEAEPAAVEPSRVEPAEPPYDPTDDFAKSIDEAYRVIRVRMAAGGPGWTPPEVSASEPPTEPPGDPKPPAPPEADPKPPAAAEPVREAPPDPWDGLDIPDWMRRGRTTETAS
jgi:hypothetical protein